MPMRVRLSVPPGSSRRSNVSVGFGRRPACCCCPRATSMSVRAARSDGLALEGARNRRRRGRCPRARPGTYRAAVPDWRVLTAQRTRTAATAASTTLVSRRQVVIAQLPEIDGPAARRAVPLDGHRPRAGHAELGGRVVAARHASSAVTCIFPDMTMPGIDMFALARTVPTSTSAPDAERNSIVKVLRPLRSVPVGDTQHDLQVARRDRLDNRVAGGRS